MNETARRFAQQAAAVIALGLIFSFFGVYGTWQMGFLPRVVYWCATIGIGGVTSLWVMPPVFEGKLAHWPFVIKTAIAAAVISVPVTVSLILINIYALGDSLPPAEWPLQFAYVLVVSLVLTPGFALVSLYEKTNATHAASGPAPQSPAITGRLPARLRSAEIYAVSAEDHYLRIHTSAGEELILMRLGDALRELDGLEGLQTHRSWWVAKDGLADAQRDNGKLVLKLKSGAQAPVSRTYQKSVREAGWL